MYEYDKLYLRPWGDENDYKEFPYSVDGINNYLPEHDESQNDVDLDSYTNTKGKTVRHRVRANVTSVDFNIPTMTGQELKDFFQRTKDVWLDCYFFNEPDWAFVSKKMYRSGTVKYHKYYIDKVNPLNNIYQNVQFSFVEE